jgi:hypothetical protein
MGKPQLGTESTTEIDTGILWISLSTDVVNEITQI